MTINDIQRAALVLFAAREQGVDSLDGMKGICVCIRNRVKAGWYDGNWLAVMDHAHDVAGNFDRRERVYVDVNSRTLQLLARDIDGIYYNTLAEEWGETMNRALYWQVINRQGREWFTKNIIRQPAEHRLCHQVGLVAFYE